MIRVLRVLGESSAAAILFRVLQIIIRSSRKLPLNTITPTQRPKAIIYARVSSKEQDREGFSIPAQLKLLRKYAEEKGFTVTSEFVDVETAKQVGRPGFNEMILHLRRDRPCRTVLVEKTDRFYRNLKDWVTVDDLDLEIHFVKENVVISRDSRSSDKLMHGIKVLMAKNYIDNLSEEVKKGMREKAEQGFWPTVAPIGYVNNLESRRIEPDPMRASLVSRLFEWYATGDYSLQQVTKMAASAGFTHPRTGRRLSKSEVHRMLHNPIYHGDFVWNGRSYVGKHLPLISRAVFDRAQVAFGGSNRPRITKRDFPFIGLLTCGECGCAITAEIKKGRYVYYHCTGYKGKCGNTYIRQEHLSDLLGEVVRGIQINPDVAARIAHALRESQADKRKFHMESIDRLQKQYNQIVARTHKAYDDKLEGKITEDFWKLKSGMWQQELDLIKSSMAQHEDADAHYMDQGIRILELAKEAYSLYLLQSHHERRMLLSTILSNCVFLRGGLCPTYKKPFDLLARGVKTQDWLGGRDSNPDRQIQSLQSYRWTTSQQGKAGAAKAKSL